MIEKIINFILKVPALVWLLLTIGFVIIAGGVLIENVASAMSESFQKASNAYDERERVYQQRVEEVKRDCDLRQQVISPSTITYRYRCAGGVDFKFEESL